MPVANGEAILVVEDNDQVREVTRQRLVELGYRVHEAQNGPAALMVLRTGAVIDLVLSDVVMAGGMSGFDVARAVRSDWPGVKVLLASGYAEDVLREEGADAALLKILRKPYNRRELARAVREALDA